MDTSPGPRPIGRDDDLRALIDVVDRGPLGGGMLGLIGEPGVGKSTLLAQAADHARGCGFTVLWAGGNQSESHLPFASLHQLLRPLMAGVDGLPARQRDALRACFGMSDSIEDSPFFALLGALELLADAAAQIPLVLCLDDVHWMDPPSTAAVGFLARRITDERIILLCTARPGPPREYDDVLSWVEVAPLDEAASDALVAARAPELNDAMRHQVVRQAGGNPLALLEFASVAHDHGSADVDHDLPMTARLERTFAGRADELDPAARAIVDVASIDDGNLIEEVLAAARLVHEAPVGMEDVRATAALGMLVITDDSFEISHPLMRSGLRQAMQPAARRRIHAALASVLSAQPERATWHRAASAAGPDERVAAQLDLAAGALRRRGALPTAMSWLELAASLSPDPADRAARLLSAAELGHELGRFEHVEQLKERIGGIELRPRDSSRLAWLQGAFHDGVTSEPSEVRHLVALAGHASDDGDTDLALQILVGAARRVWWRDPGPAVRREIVDAAQHVAVAEHDPRLLAVLALAESLELTPTVLDRLALWQAEPSVRPDLAGLLGIAAFCVGDFVRSIDFLSGPVRELRAQGRLGMLAEILAIRSWAEINLGIFDASRSADEAMRLADETGQSVWAGTARLAIAMIEAVAGGWQTRHALVLQAESIALRYPNAGSSLLAGAQLARGVAALGADRPEPAFGELRRVFSPVDPAFQQVQQFWTIGYLADSAVRTGRRDEATAVLHSLEALAGPVPALGPAIGLEYSRAVLADPDAAEELFLTAMHGAARAYPWHRARIELAYGAWLRRQRRIAESRSPLRIARSTFDTIGAHPWADRADQELRATGERGWRPTPNRREQLSAQETRIAELAARGLSNREIGQRLFLSHRTVASHLYRIFPKLGVTSRGQLAAAFGDVQSSD